MKKTLSLIVSLLLCAGSAWAAENPWAAYRYAPDALREMDLASDELERGFHNPPDRARPQTTWHWVNGNITKEGITADLEAMKRVGLGGALIMQEANRVPEGPVKFGSEQWRAVIQHAITEADRLGLEIAVHECPGWSNSGGAWIKPEQGMQVVVTSEKTLQGPAHFSGIVSKPHVNLGYYRDVALLVFPTPQGEATHMRDLSPKITANGVKIEGAKLMDGQLGTRVGLPPADRASRNHQLQIEFERPYSARSLMIAGDVPSHQLCEVQVSEDGQAFKTIQTVVTSDWRTGAVLALTAGGEPVSAFLQNWCAKAFESGIVQMMSLAKTLSAHALGILNYFHFPISSGKLEGINNKIACLKRAAYGYRDDDFFILKLYSLHESKRRLSGV